MTKELIRMSDVLASESRGSPVEVCEHITLPIAYPEPGGGYEYGQRLEIRCEECEETYEYVIKVN